MKPTQLPGPKTKCIDLYFLTLTFLVFKVSWKLKPVNRYYQGFVYKSMCSKVLFQPRNYDRQQGNLFQPQSYDQFTINTPDNRDLYELGMYMITR